MNKRSKTIKLKEVDDSSMTICRKKYGNGFRFYQENGKVIKDKSLLKRLKKLIIPPMWTEVYVCKWNDGHIQAIGRDAKGRKQYIYHSEWERSRQQIKFGKMAEFGKALPRIRKKIIDDLKNKEWSKNKILALTVVILDETGIRIGNKQYADRNGTYGLTTLRRKHIEIENGTLKFDYKGKSNKNRQVEIDDEQLIKMIKKSAELPGYEIFRFKNGPSQWQNIDSEDVNEYIRNSMGHQFSSKDFRTWVASRLAIEMYPEAIKVKAQAPRRKFSNILLRLVADELGNTPNICKSYYVHPVIMQHIEDETLPICKDPEHNIFEFQLSKSEKLLMTLLTS